MKVPGGFENFNSSQMISADRSLMRVTWSKVVQDGWSKQSECGQIGSLVAPERSVLIGMALLDILI